MDQQRHRDPNHRPGGSGDPETPEASAPQSENQEFLDVGNQILNKALSGNSQSFLNSNRQQSGQ